jgi:hypothetical protein
MFLLLTAFFLYTMTHPTIEVPVRTTRMERVDNPWMLESWVLSHGVYKSSGMCLRNVTTCIADIEKNGFFSGTSADFSAVFAYMFIKRGFGDPTIVKRGNDTEVVFFRDNRFFVFMGFSGAGPTEILYASEFLNISGSRYEEDAFCHDLLKNIGVLPADGESLERYMERVNAGKPGFVDPLVLRKGPNQVRIMGIQNPVISGSCHGDIPQNYMSSVPYEITVVGDADGLCRIGNFVLVVRG